MDHSFSNFSLIMKSSSDANFVYTKRTECIEDIKGQLAKSLPNLQKLRVKFPSSESLEVFETLFGGYEKSLENLSHVTKWKDEPMWQMMAPIMGDILMDEMQKNH